MRVFVVLCKNFAPCIFELGAKFLSETAHALSAPKLPDSFLHAIDFYAALIKHAAFLPKTHARLNGATLVSYGTVHVLAIY